MELESQGLICSQPARDNHFAAAIPLIFCVCLLLIGCASPGEPTERKPPEPAAVTDLSATQSGNKVVLSFTLPKETIEHRDISRPLSVSIYRRVQPIQRSGRGEPQAGTASPTGFALLVTIPSGMLDHYLTAGRVRYADMLQPADFVQPAGDVAQYLVRTSASIKRLSPASNVAIISIYPAPLPIDDLKGMITHSGIDLTWTAPAKNLIDALSNIAGYAVFRAEIQPIPATSGGGGAKPQMPLAKIGETNATTYQDMQTEPDKTYVYSVRSIMPTFKGPLESDDSNEVMLVARDISAPASPSDLVIVPVPAVGPSAGYIDLSWSASAETDTAGYNVYRSEQVGVLGTRLNTELLPAPVFRDMTASPGEQYFYLVTAVDRSGNESSPSKAAIGELPINTPVR